MPKQYTPLVQIICAVCGEPFKSSVSTVARGYAKYCGWACRTVGIRTHGEKSNGTPSPEYRIWGGIKTRCLNTADPAYPRYGGRGIVICDTWRDNFETFLADMGRRPSPDHSIDRIDNDGPYSPDNCRWATRMEQGRNQRTNRLITFNGETKCMREWADVTGLTEGALYRRLQHGWSVERALTESPRHRASRR
jgi:hypothetical protein